MTDVVLEHPNLPEDQTITVASEAVRHYLRSGWQEADMAVVLARREAARKAARKPPAEPVINPAKAPVKPKEK